MKVSEARKRLGLSPKGFNRLFGDIPSFRQPRLSELKSKQQKAIRFLLSVVGT
jgi:hypothetical protein